MKLNELIEKLLEFQADGKGDYVCNGCFWSDEWILQEDDLIVDDDLKEIIL